jgi:integrase
MRKNLTIKAIDAMQPAPVGRRYDIADAIVPGFGVRVTDRGKKSYTLTARFPGSKNPTRRAISPVGVMDLANAREIAREWLAKIQAGVDPQVERERRKRELVAAPDTFAVVAQCFMDKYVYRKGLRSGREIQRIFDKDLLPKWRDRDFVSIRRGDVARLLDDIELRAPVHADHVLAVLSKLCNWYLAREESYTTPIVRGMRRVNAHERARTRVLNDAEIRLFWQVSNDAGIYGAFLRTSLLTAQRRAKIREIRWNDIDEKGVWTIQSEVR